MELVEQVNPDSDDPMSYSINTRCETQEEFNELYSGDEFNSAFIYSSNFSLFLMIMSFGIGIPMMLPIASAFYFV